MHSGIVSVLGARREHILVVTMNLILPSLNEVSPAPQCDVYSYLWLIIICNKFPMDTIHPSPFPSEFPCVLKTGPDAFQVLNHSGVLWKPHHKGTREQCLKVSVGLLVGLREQSVLEMDLLRSLSLPRLALLWPHVCSLPLVTAWGTLLSFPGLPFALLLQRFPCCLLFWHLA